MAHRTLNDINKNVASDVESFIESAEEGFDSSVSSLVGNFISDCDCDNALDIDLIHKNFSDLIEKREALVPEFDFMSGTRKKEMRTVEL